MRFGIKPPLVVGLTFFAAGLLWFTQAPVDGDFVADVLPGMILMGIGGGITFNPLLLAAMGDVDPSDSGLASGIVNTAFMMGGALGLAVLVAVADSRTETLRDAGDGALAALTGGYHTAFLVAAAFAAAGALLGLLLRPVTPPVGRGRAGAPDASALSEKRRGRDSNPRWSVNPILA